MEFFVTAGGIPVHILDTRNGNKTLLLLHGYLETMCIWTDFIDLVSKKYRVITIDLPGHGLTGTAPKSSDSSPSVNSMEFCAGVIKDIMDICGITSAYIGGHSLGGYIALACCRLYPDRFDKLILFNSNPYPDSPDKENDRKREIEVIERGKLYVLASIAIPKMYNQTNLRKFDEKIRETIELCEMHDPEGICASIRGMQIRPDSQEFMKNIKIPVLVISGDCDEFFSLEKLKEMQSAFTNANYSIIADTGHNSFIEEPIVTHDLIRTFLG